MKLDEARELVKGASYVYQMQDPAEDPGCSLPGALLLAATNQDFEDFEHDEPEPGNQYDFSGLYPGRTRLARLLNDLNDGLNESLANHYAHKITQCAPGMANWERLRTCGWMVAALTRTDSDEVIRDMTVDQAKRLLVG